MEQTQLGLTVNTNRMAKKLTPKQRENEDAKFVAKKSDRELRIESLANMARPKVLEDLVGQDHIANQIKGMFASGRIPPVFILTGDSGVGKTTTARLIARYLLCTRRDKETYAPCGECAGCKAGLGHPDLSEINAADQRGIDDLRSLVQAAKNHPSMAPYRIIILDECFPAGTKVRMSDGTYVPIEDPSLVGQLVETRNPETGEIEQSRVIDWGEKQSTELMTLTLEDGSSFECTPNHPIWSTTRNCMVRADELQENEKVLSFQSGSMEITMIQYSDFPEPIKVYDITVANNHNFFVQASTTTDVLVSNCHRITDQAAPVLLKPLEDPPPKTIWMLATTNPEKLPSTILGRCHHFQLKPIEQEIIIKRLGKIARKNGVDFKEMEDGKKVLSTIANFAQGSMRNAISMLDTALFAAKSGEKIDTKNFIAKYVTSDEGQLEKQSVEMVVAVLAGDMKSFVRSVRSGGVQPRGMLYKSRFLVQYLLDNFAGVAKFTPYPARIYAEMAKKAELKPSILSLMKLQLRLVEIEQRMNTMSLDESIQLMVGLGGLMKGE